jgi:hypothetical protein
MGPGLESARLKRIGKNEAAFKALNQARAKEQTGSVLRIACECGDASCAGEIDIEVSEYEPVRKHPIRFVILPGHDVPDAEFIVSRGAGHLIVEKRGPAKEGAEGD